MLLMYHRYPMPGREVYDWRLRAHRPSTPDDVHQVSAQGDDLLSLNVRAIGGPGTAPVGNKRTLRVEALYVRVHHNWHHDVEATPDLEELWRDMQAGLHPFVLFDYLADRRDRLRDEGKIDGEAADLADLLAKVDSCRPALEDHAKKYLHCPGNWGDPAAARQLDNVGRRDGRPAAARRSNG